MATPLLKMLIHGYLESGKNWVICTILRHSMRELVFRDGDVRCLDS